MVAEEPIVEPFTGGQIRVLSALVDRLRLGQAMDLTYNGARDIYRIFGYKDLLTIADYRFRYERGGIAKRIVEAPAKATWRGGVELIEDEDPDKDTQFELDWKSLDKRLGVTSRLLQLDILSRLSHFGVLLIGAGEDPSLPLDRGRGPDSVAYLKAYCGSGGADAGMRRITGSAFSFDAMALAEARIAEWDEDVKSPRYGLPLGYQLRRTSFSRPTAFSDVVYHWSRVIHAAEDPLDDDVYGQPALRAVWNDLDNLYKVTGGGSESYFQRANPPRLWNIDKDAKGFSQLELDDFKDQIEKLQNEITKDVRTKAVTVTSLPADVTQFGPNADALMTQIAGTTSLPKRILTGSEMGELASSQDRDNWRDQVNGRREMHAGPNLLYRLVDRLIEYGYLTKPKQYEARWGAVMNMTEEERHTKAKSWSETRTANGDETFTRDEIRDHCYEMSPLDDAEETDNWRAELALKMASTNKTQGAVVFTDDEIRKVAYGWQPLTPAEKVPITAPERVSATAPTPSVDAEGKPVIPAAAKPALRAAEEVSEELVEVLRAAIVAGQWDVVRAICG